jgi:hypothetical protein
MAEQPHSIERRQKQAKTQNLLKEYSDVLIEAVEFVKRELNVEITSTTTDEIALEYIRRQGGRQALDNFLRRLNSNANERS